MYLSLALFVYCALQNSIPFAGARPVAVRRSLQSGTQQFVNYVKEPPGRGTYSLVITCLLTLVLCVWSALHLNVPPPSQTRWRGLLTNIRWIIAGVYAPELVVFTAWRQWSSGRILSRIVE